MKRMSQMNQMNQMNQMHQMNQMNQLRVWPFRFHVRCELVRWCVVLREVVIARLVM